MPRHSKRLSKVERVAMKRYRSEILYVRVYNEGGSKMNKKKNETHTSREVLRSKFCRSRINWCEPVFVCVLCVYDLLNESDR